MKLFQNVIYKDFSDNDKRKIGRIIEMNVTDIKNGEGGSMGNTIVEDTKTNNKQLHWMSELVLLPEEDDKR